MDHYGHMTQVEGDRGDLVSSVSIQGWLVLVDRNVSFTFLLKSLYSLIRTFTSSKLYLWLVMAMCSVMVELVCLPSVCCWTSSLVTYLFANIFLLTPTTLHTVHHPTLFLFLGLILGAYQQGPSEWSCDKVVIRRLIKAAWSCWKIWCLNIPFREELFIKWILNPAKYMLGQTKL